MEEIIIKNIEDGILVCVIENNEIVEKYEFNTNESATIGNIYFGTVEEILDGMQACFVDIGLHKKAFLSLKDALPKVNLAKNVETKSLKNDEQSKVEKISELLKRGQKVLVQVRKEAFEDKGPRVSSHITLAGNYLVLMPETDIITISQKINDVGEKERITEIIKRNLPENFGLIVRTDAVGVSEEKIIDDLKMLIEKWNGILEVFEELKGNKKCDNSIKKLIYNDNDVILKIARDMIKTSTKKIYVNDKEIFDRLKSLVNPEILEFKEKNDYILEFGLQTEFERINNRKIWLRCGAQIVIDKTEALTAIDVNSSRCIGKDNLEETIFKVNKEAAIEIMKQIRLKDIGGIIIIDFIDMHNKEYKDEILRLMREEQKKDRSKIEIKDFTQLNLVEMTRKKMYTI